MTRLWRTWGVPAAGWLLVLGLFALAPETASAQPSALFPDIYIHRQRPCAANEDPRYQFYRENYFGYFPTCWRRFPDTKRWNCPNPEAPNWEESLRKLPLEVPPSLGMEPETGTEGSPEVGVPGRELDPFARPTPRPDGEPRALPDLPEDDSLFQRRGSTPPAGLERPGTAPDPFAPAPAPEATESGRQPSAALDAAPALAPPSNRFPGIPSARVEGVRDDEARRASRVAPRRGLLSGLRNLGPRR